MENIGWGAIIAFVSGFLLAQLWKMIAGLISGRKGPEKRTLGAMIGDFSRSGGMPSGHAASMTAATVYLGCMSGFNSAVFALGVATTLIVLYDALNVRRAVEEQGRVINAWLKQEKKPELRLVEGHTLVQVLVGIILGVAIGLLVYNLVILA